MPNRVASSITVLGLLMVIGAAITYASHYILANTGQRPDVWDDTYYAVYPLRQYTASLLFSGIFVLGTGLALYWHSRTRGKTILSRRTRWATFVSVILTVMLLVWLGTFIRFDPGPVQTYEPIDLAIWAGILNAFLLPVLFITGVIIVSALAHWLTRRSNRHETP